MLVAGVLAGCSSGTPHVAPTPSASPDRLAASVAAVAQARRAATALVTQVTSAAQALDAADARCAVGDRRAARRTRRAHATEPARAARAVASLSAAVAAYGRSLDAVPAGAPALAEAVAAARGEVRALRAFAAVATRVWPRYAALDHEQATWVTRAFVPWYRTTRESADAYAVMVGPTRPALAAARRDLADASSALSTAQREAVRALAAADRALASPAP